MSPLAELRLAQRSRTATEAINAGGAYIRSDIDKRVAIRLHAAHSDSAGRLGESKLVMPRAVFQTPPASRRRIEIARRPGRATRGRGRRIWRRSAPISLGRRLTVWLHAACARDRRGSGAS